MGQSKKEKYAELTEELQTLLSAIIGIDHFAALEGGNSSGPSLNAETAQDGIIVLTRGNYKHLQGVLESNKEIDKSMINVAKRCVRKAKEDYQKLAKLFEI